MSTKTKHIQITVIKSGVKIFDEQCQHSENKSSFAHDICNALADEICESLDNEHNIAVIAEAGVGSTVFAQNLLRVIAEKSHGNVEKVNNELFFGKGLELAEVNSLTNAGLHIIFLIPNALKCIRIQIAHNVKDFEVGIEAHNFYKKADYVISLEFKNTTGEGDQ